MVFIETCDRELDAKHAAARGLVDAIVTPETLRDSLILALGTCLNTSTPTSALSCCLMKSSQPANGPGVTVPVTYLDLQASVIN